MSDERIMREKGLDQARTTQRKSAEFQEVPGEAEADAVRDAFLQGAGTQPAAVASALSDADGATRAHAVNRLQEERGNSYVQRVVVEAQGTPGRLVGLSQPEMVDEVAQRKGSGSLLPASASQPLQQHFGTNFSSVRVHADSEAAVLSRELNADAFTVGSDIFFADGQYEPTSKAGQGLIAHELAHVGQQTGFGGSNAQRQGVPEEEEVKRQAAPEEEEEPGSAV